MDCVPAMLMPDSTYEDENHDVCNLITNKNVGSNKKRSVREANQKEDDQDSKRMKHRDNERQRRLEVSSLFKTLRSLLPFHYIQGKRSTSDHISEAVNYIKDLKNNIKELDEKRIRIKKTIPGNNTTTEECTSSLSSSSALSSTCSCVDVDKHITLVVMPCLVGVEIIISCCLGQNKKSFLSSVLKVLVQEQGLSVVSCLSTRLPKRFMHTIVSQINELVMSILSYDISLSPNHVRVQVTRLWSEKSTAMEGHVIKLILEDAEGDSIEARGYGEISDHFRGCFEQYKWYDISNFIIAPTESEPKNISSRVTCKTSAIYLTKDTVIVPLSLQAVCRDRLTTVEEIVHSTNRDLSYVHIIGIVGDLKIGNWLRFIIKDLEGNKIVCFTRSSCSIDIQGWYQHATFMKDIFVCKLRFWRVMKTEGQIYLVSDEGISEVEKSLRIDEIRNFKQRAIQQSVKAL